MTQENIDAIKEFLVSLQKQEHEQRKFALKNAALVLMRLQEPSHDLQTEEAIATAIEAMLEAAKDNSEEPMQWTSVDDKLPAPGERVIVTNGTFTGEAYQGKDGCWHRHYGSKWECALMGPDITHWMPMPQLKDG